jgi:bla regulator protein BlaR1
MNAISNSNLLQSIGWAVFNSLWQMALLWIAYQLIFAFFSIKRPSYKGVLAASFLFAGFVWFVSTFIILLTGNTDGKSIYTGGVLTFASNEQVITWFNNALPVISVVYLLLLLIPIFNFFRNYRYVQEIRSNGLSKADAYWRIFTQKIASQMGITRSVQVWMSSLVKSPVTIGYLKPVILLPIASINHLTTEQTEAILLHELAHIKRSDYFINLLSKSIRTILYFNPFATAFGKIIERERERACDEMVMQFQYEPHSYASALLALEKAAYIPQQSFAVAASDGRKSEFRQRIEWILGIRQKPVVSYARIAGIIVALFCFAGLNALLIMNRPLQGTGKSDPFTFLSSPLQFSNDYDKGNLPINNEQPSSIIVNNSSSKTQEHISPITSPSVANVLAGSEKNETESIAGEGNSPFVYVNSLQKVIPELAEHEEKQIQEVVAETKKILQEKKWKEVEQNIADAMTLAEKNKVKQEYEKALSRQMNTAKIEDQLRIAYDQINWEKINTTLDYALAEIKLDSLNTVYHIALSNLSDIQEELIKTKQQGIPDSDISLESIEIKKAQLEKAINQIRAVRNKKIIHL